MIKFSVYYPYAPGVRFDADYYVRSHCALVRSLLGSSLLGIEADVGVSGAAPQDAPAFFAVLHLLFRSPESFRAAFAPHAAAFRADMPNYTDVKPISQISRSDMLEPSSSVKGGSDQTGRK